MGHKPGDEGASQPSLELPSVFGRRRRRDAAPAQPAADEPVEAVEVVETVELATVDVVPDEQAGEETTRTRPSLPPLPEITFPPLPPSAAASVTGLVVGLVGAGLTALLTQGCEAVRGTGSCGGTGFVLLLAVLVGMVVLGVFLLRTWQVDDPGGTSFLGVAVLSVVVMVFLLDDVFSVWMFVVIPVLAAAGYAAAWWVTTRFVEEA